jgi:hypothetical protein
MSTGEDESVSRLEKLIDEFDQNIKIVDFYIDTENYYDKETTKRNINKINNLFSDSSRIVYYLYLFKACYNSCYEI